MHGQCITACVHTPAAILRCLQNGHLVYCRVWTQEVLNKCHILNVKTSGNATTAPCKSSSRCIARYAHFQTASSLLGSMAYAAPLVFHPSLSIRLTSARIALSSAESRVLYILCCPTLATQDFSWCIFPVAYCLLSRLWCMLKTFGFEVIHVQLYPEEVGREQNGAHSSLNIPFLYYAKTPDTRYWGRG